MPGPPPNCNCGNPASWRTVQKEGANKGRNFWGCQSCNFFKWAAPGDVPPPAGGGQSFFGARGGAGPTFGQGGGAGASRGAASSGGGGGYGVGKGSMGTPTKQATRPGSNASGGSYSGSSYGGGGGVSVTLELCRLVPEVEVACRHSFHAKLVELYKNLPGRRYDPESRTWMFPLSVLEELHKALQGFSGVNVDPIPSFVLKGLRSPGIQQIQASLATPTTTLDATMQSRMPRPLLEALKPYQVEGIRFVLQRGGRGLIGDEMGLGKTLQAIGVMAYYREHWPALIIVPSSIRLQWRDKLVEWMGEESLAPTQICVVDKGGDKIRGQVVVVSYDLLARLVDDNKITPGQFKVVIADESHLIKSPEAKRTKAVVPLLQKATVALCLSGTPAVSRPVELYTQLNALQPCLFSDSRAFAVRYCNGHQGPFGWDASGSSHEKELKMLLDAYVMIRRMKKEAMVGEDGLPPKRREYVTVAVDPTVMKELNAKIREREAMQQELQRGGLDPGSQESLNMRIQALTSKLYALTGLSKVGGALDYLSQHIFVPSAGAADVKPEACEVIEVDPEATEDEEEVEGLDDDDEEEWLPRRSINSHGQLTTTRAHKRKREEEEEEQGKGKAKGKGKVKQEGKGEADESKAAWPKVLVFAHHGEVMDQLERGLRNLGCSLVRIDGGVTGPKRYEAQERFQNDPSVHVALLSITACNMGLNLTSAAIAVFAELHWVPGTVFQAEDRIHRVGQTAEVVRYLYMISDGTIDKQMWASMQKKEQVLSNTTGIGENAKGNWCAIQARPHISSLDPALYSPPKPLKQSRLTGFESPSSRGAAPRPLDLTSSFASPPKTNRPAGWLSAEKKPPSAPRPSPPPASYLLYQQQHPPQPQPQAPSNPHAQSNSQPSVQAQQPAPRASPLPASSPPPKPPAPSPAAPPQPPTATTSTMEDAQMKEMIERKRQAALALRAKVMEEKRKAALAAATAHTGGGGLPSHSPVPAYRPSQPTSTSKPAPPYPPPQQRP